MVLTLDIDPFSVVAMFGAFLVWTYVRVRVLPYLDKRATVKRAYKPRAGATAP